MEELIDVMEVYYDDPAAFLEDMLDMNCDDWQGEVASDVAAHPKVAVKSGQGVGKTALEAGLIVWFLACRPYSKVIATAPTMQQLYDVLWAEISKWLDSSRVKNLLTWTKTKVYMNGDSRGGSLPPRQQPNRKICRGSTKTICWSWWMRHPALPTRLWKRSLER